MPRRGRVLVVDGDAELAATMCHALAGAGYATVSAASGAVGLQRAREATPALVLLQRELPDLRGDEVLRQMRADPSLDGTFVIMLSAHRSMHDPLAPEDAVRAEGYAVRPIPADELVALVDAYLRIHELTSSVRSGVDEPGTGAVQMLRDHAAQASVRGLQAANAVLTEALLVAQSVAADAIEARRRLDAANHELKQEIADRTRAEQALRDSEERWKYALDGAGDGAWDWNVLTDEALFSSRWKAMLGYAEHEIGTHVDEWTKRVHPDDLEHATAAIQAHLAGATPSYSSEHRLLCKDGSYRWILDRGTVTNRDSDGTPLRVMGTQVDLTARRQAEADRAIVSKLESTGILAGGIAHDFNNLLTGILMNVGMLKTGQSSAQETAAGLLEIEEAVLAACKVTRQLVLFARGGPDARRLVDIAGELRTSVAIALSRSEVRGELVIAPDLWRIEADVEQLGLAIRGLVLNARDATRPGGLVAVRAENIWLRDAESCPSPLQFGPHLRISVIDHGVGIEPELLPKIFDPYFSTKARGAENGMGLGLSICHAIVRKHGGTIVVLSTPEVETSFHVYLPAAGGQVPSGE